MAPGKSAGIPSATALEGRQPSPLIRVWTVRMATVLLVIHLMIAAALVGVVLLQRSEGGALGIGGGGGGGFLTGRGTANLLTRVTAGLAAAFFVTSLALTVLHQHSTSSGPLLGRGGDAAAPAGPADQVVPATPTPPASGDSPAPAGAPGRGGILDKLQGPTPGIPQSK